MLSLASRPPATSTLPPASKVAVWKARAVISDPVVLQVPVAGSYSSVLATRVFDPLPPATSTFPLVGSRVAVWASRAVLQYPVTRQVPAAGWYNAAPAT